MLKLNPCTTTAVSASPVPRMCSGHRSQSPVYLVAARRAHALVLALSHGRVCPCGARCEGGGEAGRACGQGLVSGIGTHFVRAGFLEPMAVHYYYREKLQRTTMDNTTE
jgi:hypothetical protein